MLLNLCSSPSTFLKKETDYYVGAYKVVYLNTPLHDSNAVNLETIELGVKH